jgi:hypothetical protein
MNVGTGIQTMSGTKQATQLRANDKVKERKAIASL